MRFRLTYIIALLALSVVACTQAPTPRPRGYFRTDFPPKEYTVFDSTGFPYRFTYPVYGKVRMDRSSITEPYWVNVDFDEYKARIHISYKKVDGMIDVLMEDSRKLAYKHTYSAESITERFFENPEQRVYGILYDMKGNTASSWQFYVTDSVNHFLRGALYFSVQPNKDSLAPAISFFGDDMITLMESVEWTKSR